jgi:branched-chain amino acid transport system ATP-binding protein
LTGVYKPDEGSITLLGKDTRSLSPDRVTAIGMARTFQNIRLFKEMSVVENVLVGFESRRESSMLGAILRNPSFRKEEQDLHERAMELLKIFQIEHKAHHVSGSLPYGEQRKLEIARALAASPRVLLLDEPAAGMNDSESESLRALLEKVRSQFQLTILLIEHDMSFVMGLVARMLVLDHGITIATGTPAEIRANPAVIEAYLGKEEPA